MWRTLGISAWHENRSEQLTEVSHRLVVQPRIPGDSNKYIHALAFLGDGTRRRLILVISAVVDGCQTRRGLDGAKVVSTPVSDVHHESDELLDHERFTMYQSTCAWANFFATDGLDLQIRCQLHDQTPGPKRS